MAAEDRLSKKEVAGDVGAGLTGALLGAFMSPMFRPQAGVGLTRQIGEGLIRNKDALTAPFFSQLSRDDERIFTGVELDLVGEHKGVTYKDILTLLLKKMGPWASDRFRSIVIGIPVKAKKENKKVTRRDNTTEEVTSEEAVGTNPRVAFLAETVKDVVRLSGTDAELTPPQFEKGIEEVLRNLKVRNIVDADSAAAQISRWWNEQPIEKGLSSFRDLILAEFGVDSLDDITFEMVAKKLMDGSEDENQEPVRMGPFRYVVGSIIGEKKSERELALMPLWLKTWFKNWLSSKRKPRRRALRHHERKTPTF